MEDAMTDSNACTIADSRPGVRLRSRHFAEAAASVEAALDELRQAEETLERQLAELRFYIRAHAATPAGAH
jgi:hypothetical protein